MTKPCIPPCIPPMRIEAEPPSWHFDLPDFYVFFTVNIHRGYSVKKPAPHDPTKEGRHDHTPIS